jgi:hypothetical protein
MPERAQGKSVLIDLAARDVEIPTETVSGSIHQNIPAPDDPTLAQRMKLMESSGALDFWYRDEEEGYTLQDGEPA